MYRYALDSLKNIKITVRDWTLTPGFRWITDLDRFSGQRYRAEVVFKAYQEALKRNTKLVIDLEGTSGYMTSFLSEAFGGLISRDGLDKKDVVNRIEFLPTSFEQEKTDAENAVKNAEYHPEKGKSVRETWENHPETNIELELVDEK